MKIKKLQCYKGGLQRTADTITISFKKISTIWSESLHTITKVENDSVTIFEIGSLPESDIIIKNSEYLTTKQNKSDVKKLLFLNLSTTKPYTYLAISLVSTAKHCNNGSTNFL